MNKILNVVIAVCVLIGIYLICDTINNSKPQSNNIIDSLNNEIVMLDSLHNNKDSIITVYKDSIIYLDRIIENDKIKIIKIQEKYDKVHSSVIKYTNAQLDSFFSNRYRY